MVTCHEFISITDASQIGEARRRAVRIAEAANLLETRRGEVAIVATELATNLARYATRGELLFRPMSEHGGGIEIISVDRGPGMPDVGRCLEDGYSTGGTPGNGLGAVRRLAAEFDVYSNPSGTVLLARITREPASERRDEYPWGAISRPAPNETQCGDIWCIAQRQGELAILVADGLGHGPLAADAAREAAAAFKQNPFARAEELIRSADARMRGTRGAAVAAARFQSESKTLTYAGVGNIAASLRANCDTPGRGLVSHNGTVGVQIHKIQEFTYPCSHGGLLIMHSDGLQSRWSLEAYAGLLTRHPALIAAILCRDYARGRDDLTVAAVRFSTM